MTKDWKEIHPKFTPELQKEWEKQNFTYHQTEEWINSGLIPDDADYACWLKDTKDLTPEQISKLNYDKSLELRDAFFKSLVVETEELRKSLVIKEEELKAKEAEATKKLEKMVKDETVAKEKEHDEPSWKIEMQLEIQARDIEWHRRYVGLREVANVELAVEETKKSVQNIKKQDLTEIRSMRSPPESIKLTMASVCTILGFSIDSWKTVQNTIRRDDFIASIVNYNTEKNMTKNFREKMKKEYLNKPRYNYEIASRANKACGPLVKWVQTQVDYSEVLDRTKPLRNKIKLLEKQQEETKAKAMSIQKAIEELRAKVNTHKSDYELLIPQLIEIRDEVNVIKQKIDERINKLSKWANWKKLGFTLEEVKQWINKVLELDEYELADYLKQKSYQPNTPNIKEIIYQESWRDIHSDFNYQIRKAWEQENFNKEQTKEWIITGAKVDDYKFIAWLKNTKNETPQWITTYQEDYQTLSERFKKHGACKECNQLNTGEKWCQNCNSQRLKENFTKWTSQNQEIDKFIQKYQLEATEANKLLEWIPYEQFKDIEYLARGGFGKVYKAKWMAGNIHYWDAKNKQWQREKDHYYEEEENSWGYTNKVKKYKDHREVVLKTLTNSQNNTEFLQEIEKHKIIDDWFNNIVPCYGLSQDPQAGNYLMVMKYIKGGNLRHYLNNKKLTFQDKLKRLTNIIQGLKDVHSKNLIHRDFHSGNILNSEIHSFITDLGLCKPADEANKETEIYGVLPYVAPEVLRKKGYTPASDIYSLGMVAYEIFANASPYLDREHDTTLALHICQGLRPSLDEVKIPSMLKDLIKQCWNETPQNRPTASEIERTLRNLQQNPEFINQLQAVEKEYNQVSQNSEYKFHPTASMNSKLINTKEITQFYRF